MIFLLFSRYYLFPGIGLFFPGIAQSKNLLRDTWKKKKIPGNWNTNAQYLENTWKIPAKFWRFWRFFPGIPLFCHFPGIFQVLRNFPKKPKYLEEKVNTWNLLRNTWKIPGRVVQRWLSEFISIIKPARRTLIWNKR